MERKINELALDTRNLMEFEKLLQENKNEIIKNIQKSKEDIIKMSNDVLHVLIHAKKQIENNEEWESIYKIWATVGYILQADLDLKTYIELICSSKDITQKNTISRMIYIQLYEVSRDIDNLTNKSFTEALEKVFAQEFRTELYSKRKEISELKKKYEEELKKIRNTIGAHREKDYITFHQSICNIEYTAALELTFLFTNAIDDLAETIQKIMKTSTKYIYELSQGNSNDNIRQ